jgi:hypothetical protein
MAKRCFTLAIIGVILLGQAVLADVSLPITAVSFPKEVIPVEAGKIEFWAKLSGVSGAIDVGGGEPHFFQIHDGSSTFHAGFNANDGRANGGLVGGLQGLHFTPVPASSGAGPTRTSLGPETSGSGTTMSFNGTKMGSPASTTASRKSRSLWMASLIQEVGMRAAIHRYFAPSPVAQ